MRVYFSTRNCELKGKAISVKAERWYSISAKDYRLVSHHLAESQLIHKVTQVYLSMLYPLKRRMLADCEVTQVALAFFAIQSSQGSSPLSFPCPIQNHWRSLPQTQSTIHPSYLTLSSFYSHRFHLPPLALSYSYSQEVYKSLEKDLIFGSHSKSDPLLNADPGLISISKALCFDLCRAWPWLTFFGQGSLWFQKVCWNLWHYCCFIWSSRPQTDWLEAEECRCQLSEFSDQEVLC